jgi:hypothetical protein
MLILFSYFSYFVTLCLSLEAGYNFDNIAQSKHLWSCVFLTTCRNCLQGFQKKETLERHKELCYNQKHCNLILPGKDKNILKFTNHQYCSKLPVTIYCDFESNNIPLENIETDNNESYTYLYYLFNKFFFSIVSSICNISGFKNVRIIWFNINTKTVNFLFKYLFCIW